MKYLAVFTSLVIMLNACSSSNEANKSANSANSQTSNSMNANNASMTNATPTGMQSYSGFQNVNPNAFNATNDNLKVIKIEPKQSPTPYGQRIAPDDSVITTGSRGKEFFEVRTFNNHQTLAKVEKTMNGASTKYKIYLKNGKVLDAPADKMANYTAMSPENILDVVGMMPKTVSTPQNANIKKEQQ